MYVSMLQKGTHEFLVCYVRIKHEPLNCHNVRVINCLMLTFEGHFVKNITMRKESTEILKLVRSYASSYAYILDSSCKDPPIP